MKRVLGIDPGTTESSYVVWHGEKILEHGQIENEMLLEFLLTGHYDFCAIEMMQSFGMAVGFTTFQTLVYIGRLYERSLSQGKKTLLVPRGDIKMHHCMSMRAKDGNIAQALRDKYGEKGTKKNPGLTYGLSKDKWQAFGVCTYVTENKLI